MCTRPLIRAETHERYKNQKGGWSYKAEFLTGEDARDWKRLIPLRFRKVDMVPCGKCIECRLQYSREWATRCMLEKQYWNPSQCWFITLTYNDENIKFHRTVNTETGEEFTGASLDKADLQNFWKRLRAQYNYIHKKHAKETNTEYIPFKCKYLNAGEYGSETQRPHYHAIAFGIPLRPDKLKLWDKNELNQPIWRSEELEEIWGMGNVMVGELTWESAAYVARYTLKKALGQNKEYDQAQGRIPEYITMSQGIGKRYYEENRKKIYECDSIPIKNKKTGQLVKPPKAFDRLLKELDPELMEEIQKKRKATGECMTDTVMNNTSLTKTEYRQQKEQLKKKTFKDLREV